MIISNLKSTLNFGFSKKILYFNLETYAKKIVKIFLLTMRMLSIIETCYYVLHFFGHKLPFSNIPRGQFFENFDPLPLVAFRGLLADPLPPPNWLRGSWMAPYKNYFVKT